MLPLQVCYFTICKKKKNNMQICLVWRSAQWGLLNTAKSIVVHLLGMLSTALYRGKKWMTTQLVRILTK